MPIKIMGKGHSLHMLMKKLENMQPDILARWGALTRAQQILQSPVRMKSLPTGTAYKKLRSSATFFFLIMSFPG